MFRMKAAAFIANLDNTDDLQNQGQPSLSRRAAASFNEAVERMAAGGCLEPPCVKSDFLSVVRAGSGIVPAMKTTTGNPSAPTQDTITHSGAEWRTRNTSPSPARCFARGDIP